MYTGTVPLSCPGGAVAEGQQARPHLCNLCSALLGVMHLIAKCVGQRAADHVKPVWLLHS